jgi:RimJ/RimL family protein N-acetyltransferase
LYTQANDQHDMASQRETPVSPAGPIESRLLDDADAEAFRHLRRNALLEFPEAFSLTPDEEHADSKIEFLRRFQTEWTAGDSMILGAFSSARLVGALGMLRRTREKQRHKAYIWILFVEQGFRGYGIGRHLAATTFGIAFQQHGLEQIQLNVSVENSAARSFYLSCGFESFGCESRALKVQDQFIDSELMVLHLSQDERITPCL